MKWGWPTAAPYLYWICTATFFACLILGGGTRSGFLSDAVLQFTAIPLLILSLGNLSRPHASANMHGAIVFCILMICVPLLQLVPLPPEIWMKLPKRSTIADVYDVLGHGQPYLPLSMSPRLTGLSLLSLIPPLAVFFATSLLNYGQRRTISLVLVVVGIASAILGLVQIAQGPNSGLRFFEFTNADDAVGFFANRNHLAALLYVVAIFSAAWILNAVYPVSGQPIRAGADTAAVFWAIAGFVSIVVLISGEAMARSRAGVVLMSIALAAALVLASFDRRTRSGGLNATKLIGGVVIFGMLFSAQYATYRIIERFDVDTLRDLRVTLNNNTLEAAIAFAPFGSGTGTFIPIYALFEKPSDLVLSFANRAHNDILEVCLETGISGFVLMSMFLFWLVRRTISVWRRVSEQAASDQDIALQRAATVALFLLAGHSFVDYPLRTAALMSVTAFACGLLIEPPHNADFAAAGKSASRPFRTASTSMKDTIVHLPIYGSQQRSLPGGVERQPVGVRPRLSWGEKVEWPESWRKPASENATVVSNLPTRDKKNDGTPTE